MELTSRVYLLFFVLCLVSGWPDRSVYHNNQQLQRSIDQLIEKYPKIFIKKSCTEDPNIHFIQTLPQKQTSIKQTRFYSILVCNEHAREIFTAEVCLQFLQKIAANATILQNMQIKVIYNANPRSRESVFEGEYCLRTNQNGIDLNRNFPYGFGNGSYHYTQTYEGKKPLSETYSQCLDKQSEFQTFTDFAKEKNIIRTYLSIHTGEFSIYLSRCQKDHIDPKQFQILLAIRQKICKPCLFREVEKGGNGCSYEDMKCRKSFNYSNVFEVYGGYNQQNSVTDTCWLTFNPPTQLFYNFYLKRATSMIITYFASIIQAELSN